MKKTYAFAAVAVMVVLALAGCAVKQSTGTPKVDYVKSDWKYTELGDVRCAVNLTSDDGYTTDCDWNSLTSAHEYTGKEARMEQSKWLYITGYDEEVFCLIYRSGYITDCNYPTKER